jgi:hypothetical protein
VKKGEPKARKQTSCRVQIHPEARIEMKKSEFKFRNRNGKAKSRSWKGEKSGSRKARKANQESQKEKKKEINQQPSRNTPDKYGGVFTNANQFMFIASNAPPPFIAVAVIAAVVVPIVGKVEL